MLLLMANCATVPTITHLLIDVTLRPVSRVKCIKIELRKCMLFTWIFVHYMFDTFMTLNKRCIPNTNRYAPVLKRSLRIITNMWHHYQRRYRHMQCNAVAYIFINEYSVSLHPNKLIHIYPSCQRYRVVDGACMCREHLLDPNNVLIYVGWNYISIDKLQRLHRWSLGMDK